MYFRSRIEGALGNNVGSGDVGKDAGGAGSLRHCLVEGNGEEPSAPQGGSGF